MCSWHVFPYTRYIGKEGTGLHIAGFAFVYQPSSAHTVLLLPGTGITNNDACSVGQ